MAVKPRKLTLDLLPERFAIARLEPLARIPAWSQDGPLVSVTRTPQELSIVCTESSIPQDVKAQRAFRCLRILGPIAFAETGVLESIASPLAHAGVGIFVLSTYDTDYLLVADAELEAGLTALSEAGHVVCRLGAA